jgi:hypothetical protein
VGTGLVAGGFFSFAFGAAALGEPLVVGEAVVVAVFVAGFWAQPAATKARALTRNKNFFIDPPEQECILRLSATELIRAVGSAGS